ncbi:MAG: hypothetical protein JXB49_00985 [Bacteroidales bacterium]|nr:hypothetical protein [Bacteroidales bacterium]
MKLFCTFLYVYLLVVLGIGCSIIPKPNVQKVESSSSDIDISRYSYENYYIGLAEAPNTKIDNGDITTGDLREKAREELAKAIYVHVESELHTTINESNFDGDYSIIEETKFSTKQTAVVDLPGQFLEWSQSKTSTKTTIICAIRKEHFNNLITAEFDPNILSEPDVSIRFRQLGGILRRLNKYPLATFNNEQKSIYFDYLKEYFTIAKGIRVDIGLWEDIPWSRPDEKRYLPVRVFYNNESLVGIELKIIEFGESIFTTEDYIKIDLKNYIINDRLQFTLVPVFQFIEFDNVQPLCKIDEDNVIAFRLKIGINNIAFSAESIPSSQRVHLYNIPFDVIQKRINGIMVIDKQNDDADFDYEFICDIAEFFDNSLQRKSVSISMKLRDVDGNNFYSLTKDDILADNKKIADAIRQSIEEWTNYYNLYTVNGIIDEPNKVDISIRQFGREKKFGQFTKNFSCYGVYRGAVPTLIISKKGFRTTEITLPRYTSDNQDFVLHERIKLDAARGYFNVMAIKNDGQPITADFTVEKRLIPYIPAFQTNVLNQRNITTITKNVTPGIYTIKASKKGWNTNKKTFFVSDSDALMTIKLDLSRKPVWKGMYKTALVPGWGQKYLGQSTIKSIAHLVLTSAIYAWTTVSYYGYTDSQDKFIQSRDYYNSLYSPSIEDYEIAYNKAETDRKAMLDKNDMLKISLSLTGIVYLYNQIDLFIFRK